jgi:hypothetical protein
MDVHNVINLLFTIFYLIILGTNAQYVGGGDDGGYSVTRYIHSMGFVGHPSAAPKIDISLALYSSVAILMI